MRKGVKETKTAGYEQCSMPVGPPEEIVSIEPTWSEKRSQTGDTIYYGNSRDRFAAYEISLKAEKTESGMQTAEKRISARGCYLLIIRESTAWT